VTSRESKNLLQSHNFSTTVNDYLPSNESSRPIVALMEEKLLNLTPFDSDFNVGDRVRMLIPNPKNRSRALQIDGFILPKNDTILLIVADVDFDF